MALGYEACEKKGSGGIWWIAMREDRTRGVAGFDVIWQLLQRSNKGLCIERPAGQCGFHTLSPNRAPLHLVWAAVATYVKYLI